MCLGFFLQIKINFKVMIYLELLQMVFLPNFIAQNTNTNLTKKKCISCRTHSTCSTYWLRTNYYHFLLIFVRLLCLLCCPVHPFIYFIGLNVNKIVNKQSTEISLFLLCANKYEGLSHFFFIT